MLKKVMFVPFSVTGALLAALMARKLFDLVWRRVDESEPPRPDHRAVRWGKLLAALAVEGAIFRAVRGVVDRGARKAFSRATGTWPGEEAPESG
jgi:Protein of unknown function (DUF4235)